MTLAAHFTPQEKVGTCNTLKFTKTISQYLENPPFFVPKFKAFWDYNVARCDDNCIPFRDRADANKKLFQCFFFRIRGLDVFFCLFAHISRRPPECWKLSLNVVYKERTEQHKKRTKDDQGHEIPAKFTDIWVNSSKKRRSTSRRMNRICDTHDARRRGARKRPSNPSQTLKIVSEHKKLCNSHTHYRRGRMSENGTSWLRQWRLNRMIIKYRRSSLWWY
ncbi:hypothetical protein VN97_g11999 [Penicillium thymicola]|uniref:Uncharacterized protein n=1 Tax=Penicillium thymicola TaxID=293382 RepID=A0AAI9T750_PENTH|nr:hypothetical protein VN97_g11999 [Penicillium thymicola]